MKNEKYQKFINRIRRDKESLQNLSNTEKENLSKNIFEYMIKNPIEKKATPIKNDLNKKYNSFKFSLFIRFATPAFVIVILFGGIGVSAAAEDALPGDFLYSIKIGFNEKVRGVVAFSNKEKESWKLRQVERRFEEIETLADKGEINKEKKEIIEKTLNRQVQAISIVAQKFEENGREDDANNVYSKLGEIIENNDQYLDKKVAMLTEKAFPTSLAYSEDSIEELGTGDGVEASTMMMAVDVDKPESSIEERPDEVVETKTISRYRDNLTPANSEGINLENQEKIIAKSKIVEITNRIKTIRRTVNKPEPEDIWENIENLEKEILTSFRLNDFKKSLEIYKKIDQMIKDFVNLENSEKTEVEIEN